MKRKFSPKTKKTTDSGKRIQCEEEVGGKKTNRPTKKQRTDTPRTFSSEEVDKLIVMLKDLMFNYDHIILSADAVKRYATAFKCTLRVVKFDRSLLNDPNGDPRGLASDEMAEKLCYAFGVAFDQKFGRGTALHECCGKLIKYFTDTPPLRQSLEGNR